jgi:hypothetical protein
MSDLQNVVEITMPPWTAVTIIALIAACLVLVVIEKALESRLERLKLLREERRFPANQH